MQKLNIFLMAVAMGTFLTACRTDDDHMDRHERMERRGNYGMTSDDGVVFKTPAGAERKSQAELDDAKRTINEAAGAERPAP